MEVIEIRRLDIELSPEVEIEGKSLIVQGYIAVNSPSHVLGQEGKRKWREIISPGVFKNALAKARRLNQDIDFLAEHDNKKILASTANDSLFLEEDEVGLYIDAKISETSWGKDMFVLVRDGIIKGLSFGMKVLQDDWTVSPDGLPLRTIHEIDLFEISALKVPAYPTTLLESRGLSVAEVEVPKDIEKRDLQGGNIMIGENQEVTPQMMYNGMTLIADKLDAILVKIEANATDKTIQGLEDAKLVLAEVKAVAELTAGKTAGAEVEQPLVEGEVPLEKKALNEEENDENGDLIENVDEAEAEAEVINDKVDEAETEEEVKAAVEGEEPEGGETKPAEEDPNAEVEKPVEKVLTEQEKLDEIERLKKIEEENKKKELRSWLNDNQIMEVPEDEK